VKWLLQGDKTLEVRVYMAALRSGSMELAEFLWYLQFSSLSRLDLQSFL